MLQKSKKSEKLNFKKVISGVKLSLWITWSWPMPKDTTKFKITCMKLYQNLCIILAISLEASLIYTTTIHINDFAMFVELVVQQAPILHAICNFIFHKVNYHHIQNIAFEAEYFCDSMKPREEVVIQRYIDKYAAFYGVSSVIFYFIVVAACTVASIVHQPFPMLTEYPFDVYYEPLRTIIYVYQAIVAFIVSGQLCLNTFVATLLWFASARFEIIIEDLRTFTNVYQLAKCIKEHQKILEYITEIIIVARCFALTCICCSTINLIIIGVSFLSSNDISQAAFDTHWYNQSDEIRKLLQIIMLRSQKVVTIAVPCITPSISFNYLTSLVTFEMENFCELLKPREEAILQRYINKCVYFYGGSMFWIYLSAVFIMSGPVTLDQPFPTNAEYPFDVYHQPLRSIIFIQQTIACVQGAAQLCMNIFMALLIWFTSARLEILIEKLQKITNISELKKCIQEHQNLLKYAEEVTILIRPIALSTVSLSTIALIIVGLILLTDQPLSMKIQCVGIMFSGLSVVFMYTWPAEHLIHISDEIGQAVFDTEWYQQPVALRKTLQIVMLRAQKPIIISVPCVMPALSLKYYASSNDIGHAGYESSWYSKDISLQKNLLHTVSRCQYPVTLTVPCLLPTLSLNYYASKQPLTVKTQFFGVAASAIVEVFICAWPADYLLRTSNDIGYAGYESSWYSKDISLQKNLLYTVSRCQHPVTLTVPCLLPTLSLNYYASVSLS
ncbi:Odorant receptor Or2 [Trachymyrmex septentrionalis]|uniref:Odorant receptor Or2 n=1 Tax=Trachymyrmex septentrionalis TaxID=34720 RepID=A0A195FEV7_9HYME|nr:Odorant receptor Or2 [Trachymyrmex septentrionalis]